MPCVPAFGLKARSFLQSEAGFGGGSDLGLVPCHVWMLASTVSGEVDER